MTTDSAPDRYPPIRGLIIQPDKTMTFTILTKYEDYRDIVKGYIEPVTLWDDHAVQGTMWVNEEFLLGQFGPDDYNSIASDVCGLGGRPDLMFSGILGPVVVVGPVDKDGYDTDLTPTAFSWIMRVGHEADGKLTNPNHPIDPLNEEEE